MKKNAQLDELVTLFTKLKGRKDASAFLSDILTPAEMASLAERWQIVKRIAKGEPHRDISNGLKVSIAKVTRGSRALKKSKGGFARFLKKK